jgi:hypothetical protein
MASRIASVPKLHPTDDAENTVDKPLVREWIVQGCNEKKRLAYNTGFQIMAAKADTKIKEVVKKYIEELEKNRIHIL